MENMVEKIEIVERREKEKIELDKNQKAWDV